MIIGSRAAARRTSHLSKRGNFACGAVRESGTARVTHGDMRIPSSLLLFTSTSISLLACGSDPPPPSEVRDRFAQNLGAIATTSSDAVDGARTALPSANAIDLLALSVTGGSTIPVARVRELASRVTSSDLTATHKQSTAAFAAEETSVQEQIDELAAKLFSDANEVEDGIYAVPSSLICERTVANPADPLGPPITELDDECVADWERLALRIRVAEEGDALAFSFQVGPRHDELLIFTLARNSVALTVDLDETSDAIAVIAPLFNQQAPNARLSGRVTGKLTVLGPKHVEAGITIDRAIDVKFADAGIDLASDEAFRFSTAAAKLLLINLDGAAVSGSVSLGLGQTTAHSPGTDGFDLDLPGAAGTVHVSDGGPLTLDDVSLGNRTTTLSKQGVSALTIDLNADSGRTVSGVLSYDAASDVAELSVSPRFDLALTANHSALGDSPPVYDVTRIQLEGGLRTRPAAGQLEVVGGSLSLATNPAQFGFAAAAGQCVSGDDIYDSATGQTYTAWQVGGCL